MFSKVSAVIYFVVGTMFFNVNYKEDNIEELDLYAQSAVLMDADSGRILYGKNENEIMANASTTKILTCILALEMGDLNSYVPVSDVAERMPKVHLGMKEGQFFRLEDLLYSLMLESHNDSAVAIAEYIGGSTEGFAVLLNEKAKSIGCENTYFITPNGLDAIEGDKFHSTTAEDLSKMMAYCVLRSPKKEEFSKICTEKNYVFHDYIKTQEGYEVGKRTYNCGNKNAFLTMMDGVIAGKTGYTGKAGYCYVAALEEGDRTFVVSLLACGWPNNKTYKWSDAKELFQYGLEKFEYRNILRDVETPGVNVEGGTPYGTKILPVYVFDRDEELNMLLCEQDVVEIKLRLPKVLNAPVKKDEIVGKLEYYVNNEKVKSYDIKTKSAVERHSYLWSLKYVWKEWMVS